ncbi:hypothetical protein A1353_06940 [Methylomonas methanica]|uniref:Uncharacterized protein n=1 Tax=Methylomonas methanica TaxID=421 RepID=A0A177MR80_METMH|nr:hypothetical protein [Methylomonas methanica]OAI07410.1 hypothetical protein A1353_06940 [Methylomonas methanica]
MVAYLRQFLVVFLLLLQVAAPLVHAHVGRDAAPGGVHLHEFEALHSSHDGPGFMTVDHDLQVQSGVVNLGAAIKRQQLLDRLTPVIYMIVSSAADFAIMPQIGVVDFSPHTPLFAPDPLLSHNPSRAPPF